jgi:hypothetical protein
MGNKMRVKSKLKGFDSDRFGEMAASSSHAKSALCIGPCLIQRILLSKCTEFTAS